MVRQEHTPSSSTTPLPKKKKGRPSLHDLHQRKLQQQQQSQFTTTNQTNPNILNHSNSPTNPNNNTHSHSHSHSLSDSLPRRSRSSRRSIPAHFLLGSDSDSDSDLPLSNSPSNSDSDDERVSKKVRRLSSHHKLPNAAPQDEKTWKATDTRNETRKTVPGPTTAPISAATGTETSLPDKKLLLLVIDKLQKKDTRGVFAEPVDPEELPDYHEIIETPMDFGTVRKKLERGVYRILEQLEDDLYLICSNAMQYNPPSTIFFRQARSIQELAKKEFEVLRQDAGLSEPPPRPRRGRPPGSKNTKKVVESLPPDRAVSESPSEPTPASREEDVPRSGSYNLRRGPSLYRSSRSLDNCFQFPASSSKWMSTKYAKKSCGTEENRRETYGFCSQFDSDSDLLSTFGVSEGQLVAVGLTSDHSYARSLAKFAADLGPAVWRIASKKLRTVLPPGVDFGPGWVDEAKASSNELAPLCEKLVHPNSLLQDSFKGEPSYPLTSGFVNPSFVNKPGATCSGISVEDRKLSSNTAWSLLKGNNGFAGPGPSSFPIQPASFIHPRMNGSSFGPGSHSEERFNRPASSSFFSPSQFPKIHALESSSLDASRSVSLSRESPPVELHGMTNTETDMGTHGTPYWQNLPVQERWDHPYQAEFNGGLQATGSRSSGLQIGSPPQLDLMLQL